MLVSTNIYPGTAAHTALYLGIEYNLITMCPREDKPQSILRVAAIVTLLGWHFDHVPDPSRPQRPAPSPFMGKAPPQRQAVWAGAGATTTPTPGSEGGLAIPLGGEGQ